MTYSEAKAELNELRLTTNEVREILEEIIIAETDATHITTTFSDMPMAAGFYTDRTGNGASQIADCKRLIADIHSYTLNKKLTILSKILKINNDIYRDILIKYYVMEYTYAMLAAELHYGTDNIKVLKKKAIHAYMMYNK